MVKQVNSSKIEGVLSAPASKSVMIRAVAASLLASGTSVITNPSYCNDSLVAMGIAGTLGAEIYAGKESVTIKGNGGLKERGIKGSILDCGESGLCMRMFAPIAGLLEEEVTLNATGSLLSRPMKMVEDLRGFGAGCTTNNSYAPIQVKGRIGSGRIHIDGSESSQFLTGLLMALPLCAGDSTIMVSELGSKPYVNLTIDIMKRFGVTVGHDEDLTEFHIKGNQHYKPHMYSIEGDWSGGTFLLVAGGLAGSITVRGLNMDSFQADKAVIEALHRAGAGVKINDDSITVVKNRLRSFYFDTRHCPDLVPPLVALSSHCKGISVIYGVKRLRYKESDRLKALASEFSKLGIKIRVFEDRMEIDGGMIRGGQVDSHNDHRIAMACAVVALGGGEAVLIENPGCVSKSYPSFFEDLDSIKVQ